MVVKLNEIIDAGVVEEERTSQAHTLRFSFTVRDLVYGEPYIFKKEIETQCDVLPTAWSFKMKFEKELDNNIASCTLTATRTDSKNATVKADIEMSYGYVENDCSQLEQLFREEYSPGQEMQRYTHDILPFPEESEKYLDGGIAVQVTLSISCCEK